MIPKNLIGVSQELKHMAGTTTRASFQQSSVEKRYDLSSDEDEILYKPSKMLENRKERYFMNFNPEHENYNKAQAHWARLSFIICQSKGREYKKFIKKIYEMQTFQEKLQASTKRRFLRKIATTRRGNLVVATMKGSPRVPPGISNGNTRQQSTGNGTPVMIRHSNTFSEKNEALSPLKLKKQASLTKVSVAFAKE